MKTIITILAGVLLIVNSSIAQVTITSTDQFITRDQMLLANEINESGEPFAEALGYNLDDLDPMVLNQPDSISYTLGIENYEYSRYQLGTVISRSGIGLHMMWAPMIMQMAAMEPEDFDGSYTGGMINGYKEDDELMKNIMHFSTIANGMVPMNPWPQFAEFQSGNPHLPQPVAPDFQMDFSTLRWDRSLMDKTLNPGAMGQTMMKQYLWAQDMLGGFHDGDDNPVIPNGTNSPDSVGSPHFDPNNNIYYGGNNIDGFIGQVLTAESINKTLFLINSLAYDGTELGSVDPATYDPVNGIIYFPHQIAVTESPVIDGLPPQASQLEVVDASSDLFDQLSYLWATVNFKNMMDPNNSSDEAHLAYHVVFDGDPFPAAMSQTGVPGPFDLMMGTSKVIFMNLMAMHFIGTESTFVNTSSLVGGVPQPGNEISTLSAGYVAVVLSEMHPEFVGTPLEPMILNALNAQSQFIVNSLKDPSGGFYNGFTLGNGPDNSAKTAESQAAAARGLYAAYGLTGNQDYLDAADEAYNYLIDNFYVSQQMAFKTEQGNNLATYSPFNFAVITGGLREAALVGGHTEAASIYTRFFKKVANTMQLAEFDATGETGNDSDGDGIPYLPEQPDQLAPVFASEATLDLTISGIDDLVNSGSDGINVYPNPFSNNINVQISLKKDADVAIYLFDITGHSIQKVDASHENAGVFSTSLNLQQLPSGIYFLRTIIDNTVEARKITKL